MQFFNKITKFAQYFGLTVLLYVSSAQAADLKDIIRSAAKECRASRDVLRNDLPLAENLYQSADKLLKQALQLSPELAASKDAEIQNVLRMCSTIESDLKRASALGRLEQAVSICEAANTEIANANFPEAELLITQYKQYKQQALDIDQKVIANYGNPLMMQQCGNLDQQLLAAKRQYDEERRLAAIAASAGLFNQVSADMQQAMSRCDAVQILIADKESYNLNTEKQVKKILQEAQTQSGKVRKQYQNLLNQGKIPADATVAEMEQLFNQFDVCEAKVKDSIPAVSAAVAALITVEKAQEDAARRPPEIVPYEQILGAPVDYPERAFRRGINGFVAVQFTITEEGVPQNIVVIEADPPGWFEEAVIESVSRYRFKPRTIDGKPVATPNVEKRIVFKLQ